MDYVINLNIKKERFRRYLLEIGIDVKINNYSDFILKIKEYALSDYLNERININNIFYNKIPPISVIKNSSKIKFISVAYLKYLFTEGLLDNYIEYNNITFGKEDIKKAYTIKVLEHFSVYNINDFMSEFVVQNYKFYFNQTVWKYKLRYIIENKLIDLSFEEKEEIFNEITEKMKTDYIKSIYLKDSIYSGLYLLGIKNEENNEKYQKLIEFIKELVFENIKIEPAMENRELEIIKNSFILSEDTRVERFLEIVNEYINEDDNIYLMIAQIFEDIDVTEQPNSFDDYDWESYQNFINNKKEELKVFINKELDDFGLENIAYSLKIGYETYEFNLKEVKDYLEL